MNADYKSYYQLNQAFECGDELCPYYRNHAPFLVEVDAKW